MMLGKGVTYSTSCKQKINTKIYTDAELVAVNDAMVQVLWTRNFLSSQGMAIPMTTIYHDNKSTILNAENGSTSSSKCTKHLDVLYYFVTDKIKKLEVKVEHCSTRYMLTDLFAKPLQGSIFTRMWEKILNLPNSTSTVAHRSVLRSDGNKVNERDKEYLCSARNRSYFSVPSPLCCNCLKTSFS